MQHFLLSLLAFVTLFSSDLCSQNTLYQQYIEKYSTLAVEQMKRHGVPASITLAQGLLESGAGTSELAKKANNHFGIKTGGIWKGAVYYKDDDYKNEAFRKYNRIEDSFEDHSLFLKTRSRYASLFQLSPTDYKGWANGLKAAGYATNPAYGKQLISLIEIYQLYQYDNAPILIASTKEKKTPSKSSKNFGKQLNFGEMREIRQCNQTYYIRAKASDSFESISHVTGVSVKKLRQYNEVDKYYILSKGEPVYLEKKRKHVDFRLKGKIHVITQGESMHSISQFYGIRMASLYKMNSLSTDYKASVGKRLILE